MADYTAILSRIYRTPWAILPVKLEAILDVVDRRMRGETVLAFNGDPPPAPSVHGSVAVLPVHGTIANRIGSMEASSGGTSTEAVGAAFDRAIRDDAVSGVMFDIDSGGGSVEGVTELANKVRAARGRKPIYAVADTMAASAAYWIASQADKVFVTPSGMVGSIGVVAVHEDVSEAAAKAGVRHTIIHAGEHKAEGNPLEPLGDDARAEIQRTVDHYHSLFVADVAKGRDVTRARVLRDFGGGRMFTASDAVAAGLADGVETRESVFSRLARPRTQRARARSRRAGL